MFGTTLAARVPHRWQPSLVPLDLSSCIFNTRVPGTRWWIMPQPSYLGWRQHMMPNSKTTERAYQVQANQASSQRAGMHAPLVPHLSIFSLSLTCP